MYPQFGLGYLCGLFGKTRQGWYEQCEHKANQALEGGYHYQISKGNKGTASALGHAQVIV